LRTNPHLAMATPESSPAAKKQKTGPNEDAIARCGFDPPTLLDMKEIYEKPPSRVGVTD